MEKLQVCNLQLVQEPHLWVVCKDSCVVALLNNNKRNLRIVWHSHLIACSYTRCTHRLELRVQHLRSVKVECVWQNRTTNLVEPGEGEGKFQKRDSQIDYRNSAINSQGELLYTTVQNLGKIRQHRNELQWGKKPRCNRNPEKRQKLCGAVRWYCAGVVQRLWRRRLISEARLRSPVMAYLLTSRNFPVSSLAPDSNWIPGAPDSNWIPGAPDSNCIPGAPDSNWIPGAPDSNWIPGAPDSNWIPGAPDSNWIPGAPDSNWIPGASDSNWISVTQG